jgi:hypothetical protein
MPHAAARFHLLFRGSMNGVSTNSAAISTCERGSTTRSHDCSRAANTFSTPRRRAREIFFGSGAARARNFRGDFGRFVKNEQKSFPTLHGTLAALLARAYNPASLMNRDIDAARFMGGGRISIKDISAFAGN